MSLQALHALLKAKNVDVSVRDDDLVIRAPQGAVDREVLELLKRHKAELVTWYRDAGASPDALRLAQLAPDEMTALAAAVPGGAANVQDVYPLAPLQEGMLFHHLLGSDSDPYLQRMTFVFSDRARLDAFVAALQVVIQRHDILRTAFRWEGLGHSVQVVYRNAPLVVETLACSDGVESMQHLLANTDPRQRRLDLRHAPVMAGFALRDEASGEWLFALLHHHIACDHVTQELIVEEVTALLLGHGDRLLPARQYREFVVKARAMPVAAQEAYFRAQVGDVSEPTAPFGVMDVLGDGGRIAEARIPLDPRLAEQVRASARQMGVATALVFHAAWAIVLARCTGQLDVVFGTVLSGRMHDAHNPQPVAGLLVNTLPLRATPGTQSVAEFVRDTNQRLVGLLAHEHAPLALALRCSAVPSSLPLFTTLLNFRRANLDLQGPGVDGADLGLDGIRLIGGVERTNYPITVSVDDFGDAGFALLAQCVEGIDAARVVGYFRAAVDALTEAMTTEPTRRVETLGILPAKERAQVVGEFNATATDYPHAGLIHAQFEAQVQARPDAIAVICGDERLTYAQLNARANQVAHTLRGVGVRPDDRVALCLERGVAMVVGVLGVLKAGGAYVPLEMSAPSARLAFQLADCAPVAVLTQQAYADELPALSLVRVLVLDELEDQQLLAAQPDHNPVPADLTARHLAYVIYTSGSTGTPKGVMVEHRSVLRLVCNSGFAELGPEDAVGHCASPAFDAATWEIWGALLNGARLVIVPAEQVLVPAKLDAALVAGGVTALWLTAGLFNEVQDELTASLGGLRYLLIGGEALDPVSVRRLLARAARPAKLLNGYGPTETTTFAVTHDITHVGPNERSIPIGRPIGNTQVYVLDAQHHVVPLGVVGELWIGGAGVARGYWNQPELTAQRFLPDPFSAEPGARLYRTGDLGRWRADGTLEYVGRNDHQVKIRGYRIELGEIEAQLAACEGVREAVVLAREDAPGSKRLVAYLVGEDDADLAASELREQLARRLPEYMVPSAFVVLEAFPLTANGKLDRRALPAPDADALASRAFEAPHGESEIAIAALWQDLLGIDQVGRHDHFFELGGHSLLAIQLVSALRRTRGVEVELGVLFQHPTLAAFASAIADSRASTLTALVPADRSAPLPLSWAQQRLWFLDQLDHAAGAAYHIPAGLRLSGTLDRNALQATLDRIVARHESLRTRFVHEGDEPVQRIAPPDVGFALRDIDLSSLEPEARDAEVARLGADEAAAPFDLARGPLIRGQLLKLSPTEHVLLVTQHHIVSDGWSIGVLIGEVTALYAAFSAGQPDPLPPLAIQYADYAVWQRQWLQGDVLQQQLQFWRTHLDGAPALLELPTDHPRPALQSYAGGSVTFALPADLVNGLRGLGQRHGATLYMTLLAGWAVLLSRLSGQSDVVIGAPVANRQRTELESLIGFFVNTLALRVSLQDAPSVATLLDQVKTTTLAAYAHQDLPFEQVVEVLRPARSLSHSPIFQVAFSLNNTPAGGELALPGVVLEPLPTQHPVAHFDLTLSLFETGSGIDCSLEYASDLFDIATIERFAERYRGLLEGMVADAEQHVVALPLLSDGETTKLVHTFNATAADYPHDGLIHAQFEAQVQARPEAIAVICGDERLTYAQLNARANQVAHTLRAVGVRPDDRVALCLERGVAMVVGVLGVLKAGGAYVPLEMSAPSARLAFQLADCAPVAVLTQGPDRGLPRDGAAMWLDLDDVSVAAQPNHDLAPAALTSRHLAYVIYTSGSTGTPKGVMVEHRSVLRLVCNSGFVELGPEDAVGHCASPAFDAATWEIWGALLNGARLVIVPAEQVLVPAKLDAALVAGGVTALWLTAGLFNEVQDELTASLGGLRYLLIGGEALDPVSVRRLLARAARPAKLLNGYGPTETTTFAVTHDITHVGPNERSIPIGRPIGNTQVYVLDAQHHVVPLGVVGELWIGGAGVARGYWNQPELTAQRFLPDPFSAEPGARLYRTGDLGRWRADGTLEYVGRNDHQVKIRGYRIELGEIEAQLAHCEGVREAVVLAREDAPGSKRLVAYLVGEDDADLAASELREQLARRLPEYMVPSAFVVLEAFPLTANGKLDRRALPAPDQQALATTAYEAPHGAIEEALAATWQELLGVAQVGRHDDFFALGGHSLLAVRVLAAVRARLGREGELGLLFQHPTLAAFASAIADSRASTLTALVPADRSAPLPLSWAQQRLWFLDQLDHAAGAAYHIPAGLRLSGTLDRNALQATLDRIVARHESLRTRFVHEGDEPVQRIAPPDVGFALRDIDLSSLEPEARDAEVARLGADEAAAPFDLARGPLIRGQLLKLSPTEHVLLVTQHHIVSDGWSIGVLIGEVTALYAAFSAGQPDPLPPLAIQYADYAVWQRQWLQGDVLQQQLQFWRTHLDGAPALLELPTDHPRPALQSYAGGSVTFALPADLVNGLRGLGQRHGATLYMTLLAGWAVLLSRLSGQSDVVIGAPVANRQRTELESLIGFFVNTLALRVSLQDAPSVATLLDQVKTTTLAAYAHQDLPFEQVVEVLRPARSLSHSPIFQVAFSLNNTPAGGELALPGVVLAPLPTWLDTTQFDLSLSLQEAGDQVLGHLTYARDLFAPTSIDRLVGQYRTVLAGLVADATQPVATLPLLDAAERQQVVHTFNATATDYPHAGLIHAQFEAQVQARPDAIAVICGDERLTYAQLNARANQVAHTLRGVGVRPDDRVALCLERGVAMVVGVLGVLKAGGAYVPLEMSAPSARLAFQLADCAPVAVLTQQAYADELPALSLVRVLVLDELEDQQLLAAQPDHNPVPADLTARHLAYVIYTSGSTGTPKGVMVEHRSVLRLVCNSGFAELGPEDAVGHCASPAFDAATWEIWGALLNGARLVIVPAEQVLVPAKLDAALVAGGVTALWLTAGLFNEVQDELTASLGGLRYLLIGGEALDPVSVRRLLARAARPAKLLNGYGPTETTTFAVTHDITHVGPNERSIPIGRPIGNTQVYVLDAQHHVVPLGVVGELWIGGAGVARGYWNQPELTAQRFLPDPFSAEPGARLYRTGDLGRWRADGTLEYVGRNDHQVKIRGYRIELGEIEAQLAHCEGVREAVVLAREDAPGSKRLVAYLVGEDDADLAASELREQLARRLPEYMVPSAFVVLEAFPLTANGKLDRRALPAPDQQALATNVYEAPIGEAEAAIAALWQDLLGIDQVGRHDHFFELGGHSLLAIQLVSALRRTRGVEVELGVLFQHPTLAAFAAAIADSRASTLTALVPADRSAPLPLSWAQQRLWFLDQLDHAAGVSYHMPFGLRLTGELDQAALKNTLDRIVARHESLRTTFVHEGDEPAQHIAPPDVGFAMIEHDLEALPHADREAALRTLATEEAQAPFDLSVGPLIRGRLLRLSTHEHVLLVTKHHIVSDGWSIGVLIGEVTALYAAFRAGLDDPLPPLAIQYADYAVWQRQWLQGDVLQQQLQFWRGHLDGAPALLELPTDHPRPALQSYAGGSVEFTLPANLVDGLRALGQRHGTTLFMTLLAGWATLLSRLSGQDDVVIGTPVANRQRAEVEPLIGFFVNTLALRVSLHDEPSVADVLAQVKASALAAYAHQDVPFEQVVETLRPKRSLSHSPIFQVALALNNTPASGDIALPGLVLEPLRTPNETAQFELSLSFTESGDVLVGSLEYASVLFDREHVERVTAQLQVLLGAMVADSGQPANRLPLLSTAELDCITRGFNRTSMDPPQGRLVYQRFEEHAAASPDATALIGGDQTVSYGELNRRANQLAHHLVGLGIEPDDRVALCMERGPALVTAVLGILKAGAAYVPLDPAAPDARLDHMLHDSGACLLLVSQAQRSRFVAAPLPQVVLESNERLALQPDDNLSPAALGVEAHHLALLIYTSGSTGEAKAVMLEHRNLTNCIAALARQYNVGEADRILQFSSIAFDVAAEEILLALSTGATLLLRDDAWLDGGDRFWQLCGRFGVTWLDLPVLFWEQVSHDPGVRIPDCVRQIVIGGEAVGVPAIRKWFARAGHLPALSNHYGPTETTIGSTTLALDATTTQAASIPIGRPIANTQVYVLDAQRQVVPLGVVGELWIGGAGVARGYWNRAELTAERFIADPFSSEPDARLYRTGDLGCWRADGTLEYVGRNDHQVKIRGYRVELGEIESQLAACEGVREAVVLAREDVPGEKRLVAYVVARDGAAPDAATLRAILARGLPEYMVPSAFVVLEALPLTGNGKLDRRALPAPDAGAVARRAFEAPVGEAETAIAAIWQDLLGVAAIGRHDHFFELGGHSLLAVQVVSRLRQNLAVEVALRDLFAQPTVIGLAGVVTQAGASTQPPLTRCDRGAALPLSWAQQRLWFLDQLDRAAGAAYHMPAALRLDGTLDRAALQATLDRIVARHENLRTRFVTVDGAPRQVIAAADAGFALVEHDLQALSAPARDAAMEELAREEAQAPFDLAAGPLIRGRLLRLSAHEHVLLVTQHHIVSDGWSFGVLIGEVSALYAAFCAGEPDPLPELPIQYADYAVWQRQWLQGDVLEAQVAHWRTHLGGAPSLLELPTDRPRPPVQSYAGGAVAVQFPAALTAGLQALSQRHGTTLFMTLLAGWSALLSRLSGQDEVVIGTPVANRQRAELEGLIGFFVNTLALRVDVGADPSVAALLAQVKAATLDGYTHQDVPFEQVVEAVQPPRSLGHSPLFQVMLTLDNTPAGGGLQLPGLTLSSLPGTHATTHFDLSLSLSQSGETLVGGLEYASDLFEVATIERWAGHLVTLLEAMVADDTQPVSALALLDDTQRRQVLVGFNDTHVEVEAGLVHAPFAAQAARQPQAIAVTHDGNSLTYAELERRANQLAHHLIALGVRPDQRVAICLERSLDMVVGLLAILKAGGAYVPLDPAYPAERLRHMLADSDPLAVLTQASLRTAVDGWLGATDVPTIALGEEATTRELAKQPVHAPDADTIGLTPRHLAYVIYTSGSTGMPKGVQMAHGSLANLLAWQRQSTGIRTAQVLQFSAMGFDVAFQEIFSTLSSGGRLHLLDEATRRDPIELVRFIRDHDVETIFLPFVALQGLLMAWEHVGDPLVSLKEVITAGEQLRCSPLLRRFFEPASGRRLHNHYGPTETHVVTALTLPPDSAGWPDLPAIGNPIANTQVYVLDAQRQVVPLGVVGELWIGGAGVARGYWNRAELTAERFIADPFSSEPDARLYRTGDLGCWRADGTLEYVGRNDHQVKIRGYRVELGEIESQLAACEGVREAVVLAREDVPGEKRLVAYVVARDGAAPDAATLRAILARGLPEYMVPSAFVVLEALPLTGNGKLDRRALPAPDAGAVARRAFEAPVGEAETAIAAIWQDLLGVAAIGRHDHFFELGGHSLLAVQVVSRLRQNLAVEVALRDLFAQPTVIGLAGVVTQAGASTQPPLTRCDRGAALPLSWAQQRLWFLDQLDRAAGAAYHMPAALRLDGTLDRAALQATLDRIVARHENLRTRFVTVDGAPRQVIAAADAGFALVEHDLQALSAPARDAAMEELAREEAQAPFDLAAGPLIRGRLLRLSAHEHVLLVTQHHIVSDGWSFGVLIGEVSALYAAFCAGEPDPLPELPIQYADYAVWQRQWLQGDVLEAQVAHWRTHLGGAPSLLELPTDRPRPPVQSYAGGAVAVQFPAALTAGLQALSQRHGTTLFMTLLAGWSALLSRLSGQDEVVIGTPVANRQRAELEGLIGFFVNTLALRVDVGADPSVAALLAQVKAATLDGYTHQDVPFEQVVEAVQPPRSLGHSPLFQVMLTLDNTPAGGGLQLPGLTLSSLPGTHATTHFDLSLSLSQSGETLVGGLEYASDLFEVATIERWAGHLVTLLEAMVADDTQPVSALALLDDTQRRQVLVGFNDTHVEVEAGLVHAPFAAQAARQPQAIAVTHDGNSLTYAELERRANQLAHHLIALGVRPDQRVAICLERSLDMVVGLLAILKAGGAYVPLDPAYPAERLRHMLADSDPLAVLTQASLRTAVDGWLGATDVPTIALGEEATTRELAKQPVHAPDADTIGLTPRHLAYVIYTSGSTGMPKGVMVEHHSAANLIAAHVRNCELTGNDRVLQFASISFDASVEEIYPVLAAGATVVLRPATIVPDDSFGRLLRDERISVLELPTAFWHHWVSHAGFARALAASPVRIVVIGGEKAEARHVARWQDGSRETGCRLLNSYGPTEATVYATAIVLDADAPPLQGELSIGRPIANIHAYVLDKRREPVPVGVVGELYLGGACVARGYRNQPALTAERFVVDPYAGEAGARVYKTGDLVRYHVDGTLEYVGRNDHQVKIRGFRIELGEIEARLLACPGVRDAIVLGRQGAAGDRTLVAYVVPTDGALPTGPAMRDHLAGVLAEHMLPSAYVVLDAMPMTANGKVDRKALPAPHADAMVSRSGEAPVGAIEKTVARVWAELLDIGSVARHDNFFELGGHSLILVSMIDRLRQEGLVAEVRMVFVHPTVATLAAALALDHAQAFEAPEYVIPVDCDAITPAMLPLAELTHAEIDRIVATVPGGARNVQDIYPLGPLQEGLLFHHVLEPEADPYLLRTALAFVDRERLDAFVAALQTIIDRHDILRSGFAWEGLRQPMQVVHRRVVLPIHDVVLPAGEEATASLLALTDPRHLRLDVASAPLFGAHVAADPQTGEWLLVLLHHHLVCDHVTLDLMLTEMQAILAGQHDALPAPLPYRRFVAQVRSIPAQAHEEFFRARFGDVIVPTAPFGLVDVHGDGAGADEAYLALDNALAGRIRDAARTCGVTPAALFHTAWAQVLARFSGRQDVVFGTVLSGRLQGVQDADRVLGMFINTLPIRVRLHDRSIGEAVRETFAGLAELLQHEQAPLSLVQRWSGIAAPAPLFTAYLNFRHSPELGTTAADGAADPWSGTRVLASRERSSYPLCVAVDDLDLGFGLTSQCIAGIDPALVNRCFATAMESLVEGLERAPEQPVQSLRTLPDAELAAALARFAAIASPSTCADAPATVVRREGEGDAPQGDVETVIAQVWCDVLGLDSVGRHDRFFDVGGHSLAALQVLSRLRSRLQVDLGLRELFASPELAQLARVVARAMEADAASTVVPVRPEGSRRPVFLVHPREDGVEQTRALAEHLDPSLPVLALVQNGARCDAVAATSVEAIAAGHLEQVRRIQPQGPYRLGGWRFGGIVAYEMAAQLISRGESVEFVAMIDTPYRAPLSANAVGRIGAAEMALRRLGANAPGKLWQELAALAAKNELESMISQGISGKLLPDGGDIAAFRHRLSLDVSEEQAWASYDGRVISCKVRVFCTGAANASGTPGWQAVPDLDVQVESIGTSNEAGPPVDGMNRLGAALSGMATRDGGGDIAHVEHAYQPLVRIQGGHGAHRPLFCIPGAGASVTSFCSLAMALGPQTPVIGLQPRGLDAALAPYADVGCAAEAYVKAIVAECPDGPYHLVGHSFGGWVAFEVARRLEQAGRALGSVFILDSYAPVGEPRRHSRIEALMYLVELYEMSLESSLRLTEQDFSALAPADQVELLLARLIEARLLPPRTRPQVLRSVIAVFEANINSSYAPPAPLHAPVELVGVAHEARTLVQGIADPMLAGWKPHAPAARFWRAPGNHMTLLAGRNVAELAAWMLPRLGGAIPTRDARIATTTGDRT